MKKPQVILDRHREWNRLVGWGQSPRPELIIVVGRRRVGKSFLLTHFSEVVGGIYYQATNKTSAEQLGEFTRVLGAKFDDPALRHVPFPSWDNALSYLEEKGRDKDVVLILDEFPYLMDADPSLPSVIQRFWDRRASQTRFKLFLSGSFISAMERLSGPDQPLYGRRTGRLLVSPFSFDSAAGFVPRYSSKDRMKAYGVFGGLPGHLALMDPSQSLAGNISAHVLDPTGRLHDEAVHAFDAFLRDGEVHYSIVEAVASGERKWNRISSRIGKQTSSLKRPMDWLLQMGVLERRVPVTAGRRPNPKNVLYSISDPYLLFWHRHVAPLRARGMTNLLPPERLWSRYVRPGMNQHMGWVFEEACRSFVTRGSHPSLPFQPIQVGAWWTGDGRFEVDLVALDGEGSLLLGECKWGYVRHGDLSRLREAAKELKREIREPIRETTFAIFGGEKPRSKRLEEMCRRGEILSFSLDEIY